MTLQRTDHNYVSARIHARQGARADQKTWARLAAYRDFRGYFGALGSTPLSGFVSGLDPESDVHGVERYFRATWRDYVSEIADWHGNRQRDALLLLAGLPELPRLSFLSRGEPRPAWAAAMDEGTDPATVLSGWQEGFLTALGSARLAAEVEAAFGELLSPGGQMPESNALRVVCERLFRQAREPFVAVLAHLGCIGSDLVKLRGELVVRRVLPSLKVEG
jgi:hypothetical protein